MLVCEIEPRDIAAYQKVRLVQEAAGATINKEIACLSSILAHCGMWEQLRRDVKRLEENEDAGRALSLQQESQLLVRASNIGRHQGNWTPLYTVTVLGLNTGMRHSEIRRLKWKNLNLGDRFLKSGIARRTRERGDLCRSLSLHGRRLKFGPRVSQIGIRSILCFPPARTVELTLTSQSPIGALLGDEHAARLVWWVCVSMI